MGAQMVTTRLFGTIGVIQDYNIEAHLVLPESLPRLFEQRGCIRTIKDGAASGFNRIQQRLRPGAWLAGKAITETSPL